MIWGFSTPHLLNAKWKEAEEEAEVGGRFMFL